MPSPASALYIHTNYADSDARRSGLFVVDLPQFPLKIPGNADL